MGYKNRHKQAKDIIKALYDESCPTFILGDFNDLPGSNTLRVLGKTGLKDSWWEGGRGLGFTFHNYGLKARLDYILYDNSHFDLLNVNVIETELSDHNAITAKFLIKDEYTDSN